MDKLPYFRFWEKDLVKGFHYIYPDAHVDLWATTNEDTTLVTSYTAVLHTNEPTDLAIRIVAPSAIKTFQRSLVFAKDLNVLRKLFADQTIYTTQA